MSNRIFTLNDTGNAFRRTDSAPAKIGGIFKTDPENGQTTFTDGQGNVYWIVDTSGGSVTITLPDATTVTPDTIFTIKRTTAGANTLTVNAESGNIDGAASQTINTQYASYSYISDGSNYWII